AVALDLTVQSGGIVTYNATPASTLTVGVNATVNSGGNINAGSGVLLTNVLSVGGNVTNNGTLDLFTTAGVVLTFTGAASNTFGGTGGVTDIYKITVVKTANANVLELNPTNFT